MDEVCIIGCDEEGDMFGKKIVRFRFYLELGLMFGLNRILRYIISHIYHLSVNKEEVFILH